jgi:hypothetical protein
MMKPALVCGSKLGDWGHSQQTGDPVCSPGQPEIVGGPLPLNNGIADGFNTALCNAKCNKRNKRNKW